MKTLMNHLIAMIAICMLPLIWVGCQSEGFDESPERVEDTSNLGVIHNEIADEIFNSLSTSTTRTSKMTKDEFMSYCIQEAALSAVSKDPTLSRETAEPAITNISMKPVEEIRMEMDNQDCQIIDSVSIMLINNVDADVIGDYIERQNLDQQKFQAVKAFCETYQESILYWNKCGVDWMEYIITNVEVDERIMGKWFDRISWGQVAFSDAYYGWYGMMSSGCNVYVGIGGAAAGSIFSALNQL